MGYPDHMSRASEPSGPERTAQIAQALSDEHGAYRKACLNLIASENVVSPAVARAITGDLEGRYADFAGTDLRARKYRGGRFVVESEELCAPLGASDVRSDGLRASGDLRACRRQRSAHGPLSPRRPRDGGRAGGRGPSSGRKLAEAPLVDLRVEFLPFDPVAFNVDTDAAIAAIAASRPRAVVLGSSTFLHPIRAGARRRLRRGGRDTRLRRVPTSWA